MTLLILFGIVLPAAIAALIVAPPLPGGRLRPPWRLPAGSSPHFTPSVSKSCGRAKVGRGWRSRPPLSCANTADTAARRFVAALAAFTAHQVIPPGLFEDDDWRPWRIQCYAAAAACVLPLGVFAPSPKRCGGLIWTGIVAGGAGLLFWSGNGLFAQMALALAMSRAYRADRTRSITDRGDGRRGRAASGAARGGVLQQFQRRADVGVRGYCDGAALCRRDPSLRGERSNPAQDALRSADSASRLIGRIQFSPRPRSPSMFRRVVLILILFAPAAAAQKEFGFDNRKSSGQPYLTPEESVRRMKVYPGFEVKLFAAEPQVVNPVAMTVDEKGRVWVIECFEYPKRTPPRAKCRAIAS